MRTADNKRGENVYEKHSDSLPNKSQIKNRCQINRVEIKTRQRGRSILEDQRSRILAPLMPTLSPISSGLNHLDLPSPREADGRMRRGRQINPAVQDAARKKKKAEPKSETENVAVLYVCSLPHLRMHGSFHPTLHHASPVAPSALSQVHTGWRPHAALLNLDIEPMSVSLAPYGPEPLLLL